MTTTPPEAPPAGPGPGGPDEGPRVTRDEVRDLGRLRRSRTDRKVAGVAGGLARHLDIDPVILRVAFVVLVFFGGAGLILYAAWVLGTILGVAFGDVIGDPANWGLDAAFPALFLALLVPQLKDRKTLEAALLGAAIALALTPFVPAGVPIIAASAACLLGLRETPPAPPDHGTTP